MEPASSVMRDDSEPWALGYHHKNNSGHDVGKDYNLEDLDETSRSSSAEGKSVSARTTDRSDTLTVATSITTDLDADDRNIDSSNNSANKTAVAHILPPPSFFLDGPTYAEATSYDQVLMIDDEERDRAENASSGVTTAGATNTAATHATHKCLTQTHGCAEVRVGFRGEIPRWSSGSELGYAIHDDTFPSDLSAKIGPAMEAAVDMWQNHGVSFKQVGRNDPATFAVVYEEGNPKAYARAFFPNEQRRKLSVFQRTRRAPDSLPGLLAHELGHIQGLRHEFAHTDEEEMQFPSVLVGSENTKSIMNYFARPEQYQVQQSDLKELRSFYEYNKAEYKGLPIRDIDPVVRLFSEDDERRNPIVSFDTELR
ncbi:hypothetical protein V8C43DRAFT_62082 [Trichoderma afarasin]